MLDWLYFRLYRYPAYTDEDFDVSCSSWTEYLLIRGIIVALLPVTFFTGLYWPDEYDKDPTVYAMELVGATNMKNHVKYGLTGIFLGMIAVCITFRMLCLVYYKIAVILHVIFVVVVLVSTLLSHYEMLVFFSRKEDQDKFLIPYSTGHYMLSKIFFIVFIVQLVTGLLMFHPKMSGYFMLTHRLGGLCVMVAAAMSALTGYEARRFMFFRVKVRSAYFFKTRTINILEFGIVCLTVTTNVLLGHKNFRGSPNALIVPDSIYR